MVKEDEFRIPLYLSDILHKAILEVNDKGIEETSVTMGIGKPSPGEHFVTDHPFFFVIKEGVWLSNLHGAYIGPFITIFTSGSVFLSAITGIFCMISSFASLFSEI
jgi:hypothetical protein